VLICRVLEIASQIVRATPWRAETLAIISDWELGADTAFPGTGLIFF
jgi:hypothetical protein